MPLDLYYGDRWDGVAYLYRKDKYEIEHMDLGDEALHHHQGYDRRVVALGGWDAEIFPEGMVVDEEEHERRLLAHVEDAKARGDIHPELDRQHFDRKPKKTKAQRREEQRRWQRLKDKAKKARAAQRHAMIEQSKKPIKAAKVIEDHRDQIVSYQSDAGRLTPVYRSTN